MGRAAPPQRRSAPAQAEALDHSLGAMSKPTDAAALRLALERGAAAELVHAPDATLAAHLPGLTLAAEGADQIAAALDRLYPGPLEMLDFQSQEFVAGDELVGVDGRLEFPAEDGVSRRMHWLQLDEDGSIRNHLVLPALPRCLVPDAPTPGPRLERLLARASERQLVPEGYSGARVERVVLAGGAPVYVKYVSAAVDWHMRVTADPGREALLWLDGHLDRLPASCGHVTVLAEPADGGWAVVTRELPLRQRALARGSLKLHMSALRDLHAAFWEQPPEVAATLRSRLGLWWPETLASERHGVDQQPKAVERGWATLEPRAGFETAALVRRVVERSEAVVGELQGAGITFLHGDAHAGNTLRRRGRSVLIDWALASAGPPEIEMAWLANFQHLYSFPAEVVVEEALAGGAREPVLRLALGALAAGIIPAACSGLDYPDPAHRAVIEQKVEWWSHALAGVADLLP